MADILLVQRQLRIAVRTLIVFWSFLSIQPSHSLLYRPATVTTTTIALSNHGVECNYIHGNSKRCIHSGHGFTYKELRDDEDCVRRSTIGRRESLATMMTIALTVTTVTPVICAVPQIAGATSSNKFDPKLSDAVQKLFDLDRANRLVPGRDYILNVQGRSNRNSSNNNNTHSDSDAAPDPLFRYVDKLVWEERPTYRTFVALLDNYEPNVCLAEENTRDETNEIYAFLTACMATPVMEFCYFYCKSRLEEEDTAATIAVGERPKNMKTNYSFDTKEDFVQLLYKIWFRLYSRSKGCGDETKHDFPKNAGSNNRSEGVGIPRPKTKTVYGSSGFEHVFVGEIRKGTVIGLHNWIQLYRQEQAGTLDYRGTMKVSGNNSIAGSGSGSGANQPRVLTYNVLWKGVEKPVGTSLIGVSPEFELALYTMVFLVGKQDNVLLLDLGGYGNGNSSTSGDRDRFTKLDVKCFQTRGRVGSCYVEALP